MSFSDFSSWPRDQEQAFVVYEQRSKESSSKAFTMGIVSAVIVFVAALGIYAGVEPDKKDLGKDFQMSNLTKNRKAETPAPAKTEAPATAPAPEAPASDKK
jgi:hypothetical protein